MLDLECVRVIEKSGYVNTRGQAVFGTATLLHVLHCPVKDINKYHVGLGKKYVQSSLNT